MTIGSFICVMVVVFMTITENKPQIPTQRKYKKQDCLLYKDQAIIVSSKYKNGKKYKRQQRRNVFQKKTLTKVTLDD